MTDEEQKKIFSKNLRHYVYISGKSQKEIANDLNVNQKKLLTDGALVSLYQRQGKSRNWLIILK